MTHISVIIPTYNRREMLLRSVATAVDQRGVDVEVIVVDNGSQDGSAAAVTQRYGDGVRVLEHAHRGEPGSARNAGVHESTGEWVAFLDDDDVWAPTKLAEQVGTAEQTGASWIYAGAVTLDETLQIVGGARPDPPEVVRHALPVRNRLQAGPSNVLVRRELLLEAGLFDPGLRYHQDWDLWIRLAALSSPAMTGRPLVGYVVHGGNMSFGDMLAEVDVIAERYASARNGRPVDRAFVYRWIAGSHLRTGRRGAAFRTYLHALREDPLTSTCKAVAAALDPRVGTGTTFRKPGDPAWRAQADAWLAPLRDRVA